MIDSRRLDRESIARAAELLKSSEDTVLLTGAGISTPSGVPDFRSTGSGLWTRYLPMEVATLSVFRQNPEKFFEWLRPLASRMYQAEPNPAHEAIANLEEHGFVSTLITQNIDVLHHRAGSKNILEIHGTLNTVSCTGCYQKLASDTFIEPFIEFGTIPRCPDCNKILKPDAVLFEEQLPAKIWLHAKQAVQNCDVLLVAGSSLVVTPVASLPIIALENSAKIIIVNQTSTYIDVRAELIIQGDVADILPAIASEVLNG